jgi:phage shock protein C
MRKGKKNMKRFRYRRDRKLYRSRRGVLFGVCRGLAEYFNLSVFWTRMVVVIIFLVSGLWPITLIYVLASLLMTPEPVKPLHSTEDSDFYDAYLHTRSGTIRRMSRRFANLDRRIRRMEDVVTGKDFEWERRMNS